MAAAETTPDVPGDSDRDAAARHFWLIASGLCGLGLLRGILVLREFLADNPLSRSPISDAGTYWRWAERIADGVIIGDTPFLSAPLYPYLLGAVRAIGAGLTFIYSTQLVLHLATAVLIALIGRCRFKATVGLVAAGLFLLLAEPAFLTTRILGTTVQMLLLCMLWWQLLSAQRRNTIGAWGLGGVACGINCLVNPPMLLLVAGGAAAALLVDGAWRSRVQRGGAFAAGAVVVIGLSAAHNYFATGGQEIIPITSHAGITFRQGNIYPDSTGTYTAIPGVSASRERMHEDAQRLYRQEAGRSGTWGDIDKHFRNRGFAEWGRHPGWAVQLAARKFHYFLSGRHASDIYQMSAEVRTGLAAWMRAAPIPVPWLMGPALVALVLLGRSWRRYWPELMLVAVPLAVVVLFWYSPRYRAPVIPVMTVLCAWALVEALAWRERRGRAIAVVVALMVSLALGFVNERVGFDPYAQRESRLALQLGLAYREQDRLADAVDVYRDLLEREPDHWQARHDLGSALEGQGTLDEALEAYEQAFALMPASPVVRSSLALALIRHGRTSRARQLMAEHRDLTREFADAHYELAIEHVERGDTARAIDDYRDAIRLDPDFFEAHNNLGSIFGRQGRAGDALVHFREALRIQPNDIRSRFNLAQALAQSGNYAEAKRQLHEVLRLDPTHTRAREMLGRLQRVPGGG